MHSWELNSDPTEMHNAQRDSQSLVSLPVYPQLPEESVDHIVTALAEWSNLGGLE